MLLLVQLLLAHSNMETCLTWKQPNGNNSYKHYRTHPGACIFWCPAAVMWCDTTIYRNYLWLIPSWLSWLNNGISNKNFISLWEYYKMLHYQSRFRDLCHHWPDQLFFRIQDVEQLVSVDFLWSREENNLKFWMDSNKWEMCQPEACQVKQGGEIKRHLTSYIWDMRSRNSRKKGLNRTYTYRLEKEQMETKNVITAARKIETFELVNDI